MEALARWITRVSCVIVICFFVVSTLGTAIVEAKGKPSGSSGGQVSGLVWEKSGAGYKGLDDALVTLSPVDDYLWSDHKAWFFGMGLTLKDSFYQYKTTETGFYKLYKPSEWSNFYSFVARVWYDAKYLRSFDYVGDHYEVYSGILVAEKVFKFDPKAMVSVSMYPEIYNETGNLAIGAVRFCGDAANYGESEVGWHIIQTTSYTLKSTVSANGGVSYGGASFSGGGSSSWDKTQAQTVGVGQTNKRSGPGAMVGHISVHKVRIRSIWPNPDEVVQVVKLINSDSKSINTYAYSDAPLFDEATAKSLWNSGNYGPGTAWIPRASWEGGSFPCELRTMDQSSLGSKTWTVTGEMGGSLGPIGGKFAVQMSWASSTTWEMHWTARLLSDPGSAYAGALVFVPKTVVDPTLGVAYTSPYNIMYVFLCVSAP